jgi:hypothetical protein
LMWTFKKSRQPNQQVIANMVQPQLKHCWMCQSDLLGVFAGGRSLWWLWFS